MQAYPVITHSKVKVSGVLSLNGAKGTGMSIAFEIPVWLLWVIGIPAALIVICLAVIGGMFLWGFRGGIGWH